MASRSPFIPGNANPSATEAAPRLSVSSALARKQVRKSGFLAAASGTRYPVESIRRRFTTETSRSNASSPVGGSDAAAAPVSHAVRMPGLSRSACVCAERSMRC